MVIRLLLCLHLVVLQHSYVASSACLLTKVLKGEETNICYQKKGTQHLLCGRHELIVILKILHRVKQKCDSPNDCCKVKSTDEFYDIHQCSMDSDAYMPVIRYVLDECSQRRYCILINEPGSSIFALKNITFRDEKKTSSIVTAHKCIKVNDPTLRFCDRNSTVGKSPVFISSQGITSSDGECTCEVSTAGNSMLTLLDVRLAHYKSSLVVQTETGGILFRGARDSLHFAETIPINESKWTLRLSTNQGHPPDNIWIKVEGEQKSYIEVNCRDPRRTKTQTTPSIMPGSETEGSMPYFPYVMFGMGFVLACAGIGVCIFIFLVVKRKYKSRTRLDPVVHYNPSSYRTPEDDECAESVNDPPTNQHSTLRSASTKHGSISQWKASFSKYKLYAKIARKQQCEMTVQSDDDTPGIYEPVSTPRSNSKPDLYNTASVHSIPNTSED